MVFALISSPKKNAHIPHSPTHKHDMQNEKLTKNSFGLDYIYICIRIYISYVGVIYIILYNVSFPRAATNE